MPSSFDITGTVFKNGTGSMLARVEKPDGTAIVQADVLDIHYSIYLTSRSDPDARTVVTGHDDVVLLPEDVIYDTLQTGEEWTIDETGYNFAHTPPITVNQAFPTAGVQYLVEYTLTLDGLQPVLVRFLLNVI